MRVVAFDTETTGTDPATSRIVEITLAPVGAPAETFRVNPGVPIPPEASAVHGIYDSDVVDCPPFAAVAPKVQALLADAILLGYNSRSFDTPLLHAELRRAGQPGIDLARVPEIDVLRVWHAIEPRTLSGAVRRWLGEDHDGAHSSKADVDATVRVWERMVASGLVDEARGRVMTRPVNELDRDGKLIIDERGEVVLTFGKNKGIPLRTLDLGYLQWMMGADFSTGTKAIVSRVIEHKGDLPEAAALRATLASDAPTPR